MNLDQIWFIVKIF